MSGVRIWAVLMFLAAFLAGCSDAESHTEISAVVAPHFSSPGGLATGDPVAGGELRLYVANTVVLETVLNDNGTALVAPEPGTYDLQVSLDSTEPGCFWGETIFAVSFPSTPLVVEVAYICAGQ